jgi:iron complex outermembrane recepter protein
VTTTSKVRNVRAVRQMLTGGALIAFVAPCLAYGQEPQASSDAAGIHDDEIIVTAQRREEAIEDVPMAMTVVTGESLRNAGVVSFQDLGAVTAGAQVNFAGAFTQPTVRGITTLTNGTLENNVAVYVDGFYEPNPLVINTDLPNLASIEVLKGPQGTLYGRNATGGAILLNTLKPSKDWTGRAEISFGRFEDKRASGYVSGPIADAARFSLAGYYRHTDSYVKLISPRVVGETVGPATPVRQASFRAKLEIDLTEAITATLGYNFVHVDDARTNQFAALEFRPATIGGQPFPSPPISVSDVGQAANNRPTRGPTEAHQGTLKLALDTGIGTLTSYTGYQKSKAEFEYDTDGTYLDLSSSNFVYSQKTFQQAIDFAIDAVEGFDLLIGGLYWSDLSGTDLFSYARRPLLIVSSRSPP